MSEISTAIGQSSSYISKAIQMGALPARKIELLGRLCGPEFLDILPDPVRPHGNEVSMNTESPWSIRLDVRPNKVRVEIDHLGSPLYAGWSWVKGDSEKDLLQAISYATHMCYKLAEQKSLGEEV